MSFSVRNLSVLAYANGFTLWHYKAGTATTAQVSGPAFFDGAADLLATGDIIMVSAADGARIVVTASRDSGVVIAPLA